MEEYRVEESAEVEDLSKAEQEEQEGMAEKGDATPPQEVSSEEDTYDKAEREEKERAEVE